MNYLSKANLIAAAVLSFAISAFLQWYKISSICGNIIGDMCGDTLFNIKMGTGALFWVLLPVFFAVFLNSEGFSEWRRFAVWAAPVMLILFGGILFMDTASSGGWGIPAVDIAALLILPIYALYFLASLVVIYRAWRGNKNH